MTGGTGSCPRHTTAWSQAGGAQAQPEQSPESILSQATAFGAIWETANR